MSTQNAPQRQFQFHGVYTAGNPADRPRGTASKCQDFRVMPGFWLRLRGGRVGRTYTTDTVQKIHPFTDPTVPGGSNHLAQMKAAGGATANWNWFALSSYTISPGGIEAIATSFDGGYALNNPAAAANLNDRVIYYNGLGVRDTNGSRPALSSYFQGVVRYHGLDAYCPSSTPSAAFTAGGGGFNQVFTRIEFFVGLYHAPTGHYSNSVSAGVIGVTGASGVVTISGLNNLKMQYHNGTEQGELFYVFYATVDGSKVPYLILNNALDGPLTASAFTTTKSLSVTASDLNGFILDLTKESPVDNFPPRPMRTMAVVNNRVYGALLSGGSGGARDFTYIPEGREQAGVVFSRAQGELEKNNVPGDPLQCFPVQNVAYTPSAEQPLCIVAAQDNVRVLVITATSTFLLEEVSDGLQEYITVSRTHGIKLSTTLCVTRYGIVWMDQRNQIVMLPPNSLEIVILSGAYQNSINAAPRCADYLLDPLNEIDRYEVFLNNGTSVIHDFRLGNGTGSGEGYTCTGKNYTAARTCVDTLGVQHHIVANVGGWYTQEAQPENGLIPTLDETYTGPSTTIQVEINGEYDRNWDDLTHDQDLRKQTFWMDVLGDGGAPSLELSGVSPLSLIWRKNFIQTNITTAVKAQPQDQSGFGWRFPISGGNAFWYKFILKLAGHALDDASYANHQPANLQGDIAKSFYGCILRLMIEVGTTGENRT